MLPYTVNSPRSYKGKSGKMRQGNTWLIVAAATLLLTGFGGLWYVRAKSAHVTGLLAVITEHGREILQTPFSLIRCCRTSTTVEYAPLKSRSKPFCFMCESQTNLCLASCRNKV